MPLTAGRSRGQPMLRSTVLGRSEYGLLATHPTLPWLREAV